MSSLPGRRHGAEGIGRAQPSAARKHGLKAAWIPVRSWAGRHLTGIGFAAITAIAGLVRFHSFARASLWLDEGSTIYFSHLPWVDVLGLRGGYDTHPPLYYALVKATSLLVGDVDAGRVVSVVGGTLSVLLLLHLAERLAGRRVALVAGMLAATAPLLVWYSQEARQYEVTSVAVLASYLALIAYDRRPRAWIAVAYGVALVAAMYLDYSAAYPLVPQVLLVGYVIAKQRSRAVPLLVAAAVALVAYAPWLPYVSSTVTDLGASRSGFLGVSMTSIIDALRSVVGVAGSGVYYATALPPPFHSDPTIQVILGGLALATLAGGLLALSAHRMGWPVALCLSLGTFVVSVAFSAVSPGFAPRTVSYAVFGWSLIVAAAAAGRIQARPWPRRTLRTAAVVLALVPVLSLSSVYAGVKQDFRGLAVDTLAVVRASGFPLLIHPTFIPALITAYAPAIQRYHPVTVYDAPDPLVVRDETADAAAVIVSYMIVPGSPSLFEALQGSGMERVMHAEYFYGLALDIWARPDAPLGRSLDVDFRPTSPWTLPVGAHLGSDHGAPQLSLAGANGETGALLLLPAAPSSVYTLSFRARLSDPHGAMRAFLICSAVDGGLITVSPNGAGAGIPADGAWHTVRFSAYCPPGTAIVRVDLRNAVWAHCRSKPPRSG